MKISSDQIDTKSLAGKTGGGQPIVYIASKGGLHAFFYKNADGNIESLAAAPHRAIAQWMAEQKDPKIEWDSDFGKSEDKLAVFDKNRFHRLRSLMFQQTVLSKSENIPSNQYLVYSIPAQIIVIQTAEELTKNIKDGGISRSCLVRNLALIEPVCLISDHPKFKDVR